MGSVGKIQIYLKYYTLNLQGVWTVLKKTTKKLTDDNAASKDRFKQLNWIQLIQLMGSERKLRCPYITPNWY